MKKWLIISIIAIGIIFVLFFILFLYMFYLGFQCPSYTAMAIDKKDISYCEKHSYACDPNDCYFRTAIRLKNISICKMLKDNEQIKECLIIIEEKPEECLILNKDILVSDCLLKLQNNITNISICKSVNIKDEYMDYREKCFESLYRNTRENIDSSFCFQLEGPVQDECYNQFLICQKVKSSTLQSDCFLELAFQKNDPAYCEKVNQVNKDECFIKLAQFKSNVSICDSVSNPAKVLECKKSISSAY